MSRLWDKGEAFDDLVLRFTVGQDYLLDARLVASDVKASKAHATMLAKCGYLTETQAMDLGVALEDIGAAHESGQWSISVSEEDAHTALEGRLIEKCGDLGKRIHLGRSRNDQILVALRLYYRDAIAAISEAALQFAEALDGLVSKYGDLPMPGYTHMQRAMPSSVALWAGAFASEIRHSLSTLSAAEALVELNPLGSGAGYGAPTLNLDRALTTQLLGFRETHEPVTAPQLSRGKAELALGMSLVLLLQDIGRLSADLCQYASQEFGFVKLPKPFTTGSSIMPQKRNPDVFELVRGKSAAALGDWVNLAAICTKMTSGYHRDLQLLKEPMFRMIDTTLDSLRVMAHAIPGLEFQKDKLAAAMTSELFAAERAFKMVAEEGMSFRNAYAKVAEEFA